MSHATIAFNYIGGYHTLMLILVKYPTSATIIEHRKVSEQMFEFLKIMTSHGTA